MATSAAPLKPEVKKVKKRVFNLDTFEKETKEAEYTFIPIQDAVQLQEYDPTEIVKLVNVGLARKAMKEAKATIQGGSPKVVNTIVNALRFVMFTDLSREDQTKAIYQYIKSNDAMFSGIKAKALAAPVDDEDEDEDDE